MAEEAKVTPESEKIDSTATPAEKKVEEGTVESEMNKLLPPEETKKETDQETVPLSVYLSLKDDLKEIKREMKEAKTSEKPTVQIQGLSDLTKKYPGVDEDFIKDMLSSATIEATKKIEEKYSPIIEKQETEKKQAAFDKAFDNLYEKTISENPDLPKNIDKDAIKALALTPKYRNVPLSEILMKIYAVGDSGKSSSENDARSAADKVDDVVSFEKITPDQKKAIMEDPKARQKYFNWLDSQPG